MKKYFILFVAAILLIAISGCSDKKNNYQSLNTDTKGTINIMLWSGDGSYMTDIGHNPNYTPQTLTGQNQAAMVAVAKAFNQIYPNVIINVYAKAGGPDDGGVSWAQEFQNFKTEHGSYPDLWDSTNLPQDVEDGYVANLSAFSNDPMYQSFNPSIMKTFNYYGFQAALPEYIVPQGIYVDKSLAEQENWDVPTPDWNIQQYTDFISQADGSDNIWGMMDPQTALAIIETGTATFTKQLQNPKNGQFIDINSDQVRNLLQYEPIWSKYAVWSQWGIGNVPNSLMTQENWSSWNFFKDGKTLTDDSDPWMMGDAANPNPQANNPLQGVDWDIYPRPSTPYEPETIGIDEDPLAVYNHCMDDGNPTCTVSEMNQIKLDYTFASFWQGDTRSWEARALQMYTDTDGSLKTSLNDSFPVVKPGTTFNQQMNIWYSTATHQRFQNTTLMPGFQQVLKIYSEGQFWDVNNKIYPSYSMQNGTLTDDLYEWDNLYNPKIAGADRTDADWLDQVDSRLPAWNTTINQRYTESFAQLQAGLEKYYGFTPSDFGSNLITTTADSTTTTAAATTTTTAAN